MSVATDGEQTEELARADRIGRKVGIGCISLWLGGLSMAMVAVLLGKAYAFLTRAATCEGIPLCDWHRWAAAGFVAGALTLPILVLTRLGRPAAPPANSDRG